MSDLLQIKYLQNYFFIFLLIIFKIILCNMNIKLYYFLEFKKYRYIFSFLINKTTINCILLFIHIDQYKLTI